MLELPEVKILTLFGMTHIKKQVFFEFLRHRSGWAEQFVGAAERGQVPSERGQLARVGAGGSRFGLNVFGPQCDALPGQVVTAWWWCQWQVGVPAFGQWPFDAAMNDPVPKFLALAAFLEDALDEFAGGFVVRVRVQWRWGQHHGRVGAGDDLFEVVFEVAAGVRGVRCLHPGVWNAVQARVT